MKKTILGCVLSLVSTAWLLLFAFVVFTDPVPFVDPSGWLITNLREKGLLLPAGFFLALFFVGIAILCMEYFKKEK